MSGKVSKASAERRRATYRRGRSERLDAILVKVGEVGVEGLEQAERDRLAEISDELSFERDLPDTMENSKA